VGASCARSSSFITTRRLSSLVSGMPQAAAERQPHRLHWTSSHQRVHPYSALTKRRR
jgi:hypothetical protein